jgi:hypothetical protein
MNTVQVISDAKASPIITAFTMTSADMNITQGDNSFIAGAIPDAASGFAAATAADGVVGDEIAGAVTAGAAGDAGDVAEGAAAGAGLAGVGGAICCVAPEGGLCVWAETGDASQAAASIAAAARLALEVMVFILRPSSE